MKYVRFVNPGPNKNSLPVEELMLGDSGKLSFEVKCTIGDLNNLGSLRK